jgi:hypothetical protein
MTEYAPWAEALGLWIAAGITIAIYSFLYKDNPFYKLAEHIYIGVSTGYLIVIAWQDAIRRLLYIPLVKNGNFWVIIPGILGLLMFTRFFRKISWLSRFSLAFIIGWGAGTAAPNVIKGMLIPHVASTIKPVFNPENFTFFDPANLTLSIFTIIFCIAALAFFSVLIYLVEKDKYADLETAPRFILILGTICFTLLFFISATGFSLGAFMNVFYVLVMLVGVISVLFYFFYSIEHKKTMKGVAKTGILFLMVFFGTAFGYTVMGRVSLAIGRITFLVDEWIRPSTPKQWVIGVIVAVLIGAFLWWQDSSEKQAEIE